MSDAESEDKICIDKPFFAVFPVSGPEETIVADDLEIICDSVTEAQDFATGRVAEDGEPRAIVRCVALGMVEVPAPRIRQLKSDDGGLPPGTKRPPKPKNVVK